MNTKFVGLAELEANDWAQIQPEVRTKGREADGGQGRKGGEAEARRGEVRRCGRASVSEGLRALIALRRKEAGGRAETAPVLSPPEVEVEELVPEKSFDGGFFTVSSPAVAARRSPCLATRSSGRPGRVAREEVTSPSLATRSTGRPRGLARKEVTESARRTACLVSPFISQFAKLNLTSR